ncbi:HK97 gp10 family phage protein [Weissella tructae]
MAKMGTFDYSEFSEFVENFESKSDKKAIQKILNDAMTKALRIVLADVKENTPEREVNGGTLRRGWQAGPVKSSGKKVTAEVFNDVHYAPHVEYGHRTRGGRGFVAGQYMLTNTLNEVKPVYEKLANEALEEYFADLFK